MRLRYYDKQKKSTLDQIDHLYGTKDTSFRGFRHSGGNEIKVVEKMNVKS